MSNINTMELNTEAEINCLKDKLEAMLGAEIKLKSNNPSKLSKVGNGIERCWDKTLLTICKPFSNKVEDIKYKQEDFAGWEADGICGDIIKVMDFYVRKSSKKLLSPKDMLVVGNMRNAAEVIDTKKNGKLSDDIANQFNNRLIVIYDNYNKKINELQAEIENIETNKNNIDSMRL